jgi:hypothetical protein
MGFFTLDVLLLVVMPLAFLKEICSSANGRKRKKKAGQKLLTGVGCCCFLLIFFVDGFIFNTYLKAPTISQMTTQLGLQGSDDQPDKTLH